ncbi:MAG TPA: GNAT family N-acetyltransferase [Trichocoleus sp.]|jgi:predicted GNAT family N-acyltransferase
MSQLKLQIVRYNEAKTAIDPIRRAVFQEEQQVEAGLDFDGLDEAATQMLAYWEDQPVGTARIRYLSDRLAKIERVAVLAAYRGLGIGKQLMNGALDFLEKQGVPEAKINAQMQVKDFYEQLGFQQQGEPFYEAGLLHVEMRRK